MSPERSECPSRPARFYRKKHRRRSPPEETDEEEGLSTVVEYTTATESESEVEQRIAHRRPRRCGCCGRRQRQACWDGLRDIAIALVLLYWVLDMEARKRKWWWYAEEGEI